VKALGRLAANGIALGVIVVLLAPAVARAAQQLAVPVLVAIGLLCLVRLIWFYTSL
jgi:hypothetical protein